ncbi:MAG: photosynthetic complex putative assembly protein PuhB [Chromatiales bacterium]
MNEYESEPVRGLPEELPPGEWIIWQGEPRWQELALRVFHVRAIALYFVLLAGIHLANQLYGGVDAGAAASGIVWLTLLGAAAVGVLCLLARLFATSTVYTITNHRLVMRFGVAIQMMINLPWSKIESVDVKLQANGTGDVAFTLDPGVRLSYWIQWPHARPWHFSRVRPMLRGIPEAEQVATHLGRVLEAKHAAGSAAAPLESDRPVKRPGIRTAAVS